MTQIIPATSGTPIDVAIIGAGPYGLSIAAHLTAQGTSNMLAAEAEEGEAGDDEAAESESE